MKMKLRQWIWLNRSSYPEYQSSLISGFCPREPVRPAMAVFRKVVRLGDGGGKLKAYFSGDSKFRLYINGNFVDDGPVEAGGDYAYRKAPGWWFAAARDITEFCRPGANVIVAEVWNMGLALTDFSQGTPGFALELYDGENPLVNTDQSWKGTLNSAFTQPGRYEAWHFPFDYHDAAFDDSTWPQAEETGDDRTLELLDLPALFNDPADPEEIIAPFPVFERQLERSGGLFPLTVKPGIPVVLYFRFADELAAHVEFELEASPRAVIRIEYQEHPEYSHYEETYVTAGGRQKFRTIRMNAFQYLKITVVHATFHTPQSAPVIFHSLRAFRRGLPLAETARFSSSEPRLDQLRACCDRTLRLCSQRLYLDSPVHQEPSGCTGDYMIEALMSYMLHGETRLAAADLRRTAYLLRENDGFMFHTSYSLMFIMMLRDYYYHSTDFKLVEELRDAAMTVLHRFQSYLGREGIVSNAPNYLFIDWVIDGDINYHHPPASHGMACMTAFYYQALRCAVDLFPGKARELQMQAESVKDAFNRVLWDESRQCYADGIPGITEEPPSQWLPPDTVETSFSVQANALALAYGMVPPSRTAALVEKIMTDPALVQPQMYFMHFVFEALKRTGSFNRYGFEQLERWYPVVAEHPSSLKEAWHCGDYSHAWGGTPAYQCIHAIVGLEVLEPGFRKVRFAPNLGPLTRLEAEIPTPYGKILFKAENGRHDVQLPPGIKSV